MKKVIEERIEELKKRNSEILNDLKGRNLFSVDIVISEGQRLKENIIKIAELELMLWQYVE